MYAFTQCHPIDTRSRRKLVTDLRTTRRRLGLRQIDVAEDLHVTLNAVARFEQAVNGDPYLPTAQRYARAVGHAVRFRLCHLDVTELPAYPHLPPHEQDARHRSDLRTQLVATRRALRLTHPEVGERMGVSASAVSKMETAAREACLSTFQRYARALGGYLQMRVTPAPAVDEVAIRRTLKGAMPFGALTEDERFVLFHSHVPRSGDLTTMLGISGTKVAQWRHRVGQVAA